jgi:hypothetical protein
MIDNKADLLDPAAGSDSSEYEKEVVEDARNAGNGSRSTGAAGRTSGLNQFGSGRGKDALSTTAGSVGALNRTVIPGETTSAESEAPGGGSDISGGEANLDAERDAPVEQNEFNR